MITLTVEHSELFQSEYKMFRDKISKLEDPVLKEELEALLVLLLKEVRRLDVQHKEIGVSIKTSTFVEDIRSSITSIRQTLMKKLKD